MVHRAIVAYEQKNGTYSLHFSARGASGRLHDALSETTPFGADTDTEWAKKALARIRQGTPLDASSLPDSAEDAEVEPVPRATADSFDAIGNEHLDFLHYEALHVVDGDGDVTTWVVLWPGLGYESGTATTPERVGNGILVETPDYDFIRKQHRALNTQWAALRDVVGDNVDNGWTTVPEAGEYLRSKLKECAKPSATVWISDDYDAGSSPDSTEPASSPT